MMICSNISFAWRMRAAASIMIVLFAGQIASADIQSIGDEASAGTYGATAAATVWTFDMGTTSFTKGNYADVTAPENQDRITATVWLTRSDSKGLFNIAAETEYGDGSPAGTEWAFVGLNQNTSNSSEFSADNYSNLVFHGWKDALANSAGNNLTDGHRGVLHLIDDDIYLDIQFTTWTSGGGGGGFSYVRAVPEPSSLALAVVAMLGFFCSTRRRRR